MACDVNSAPFWFAKVTFSPSTRRTVSVLPRELVYDEPGRVVNSPNRDW
jgi:hypothetical protein